MLDAGFVDVDERQFEVPYWRDTDRPETAEVPELMIGDGDGYFWHAIPRMVESLGFKAKEIRQMQML
jgi:hypothetical protein